MGHVQKRNGKFIARYRAPDGKERSRTFSRSIDAKNHLAEQMLQRRDGRWIDPAMEQRTFRTQTRQFEASRLNLASSTQAVSMSLMRNHVLPYFGDMRLAAVRPTDVQAFVAHLDAKGLSASTVRQAYLLVSGVFESALRDDRISRTPCRDISLPRSEPHEQRYLTAVEIVDVARASGEYELVVLTAAYTGMRWGELAGLTFGKVNFFRRTITVSQAPVEVGGKIELGTPKLPASSRTISVPSSLLDRITESIAGQPQRPENLVFTTSEGKPMRRSNFRRRIWLPAVEASVGEPCTFHDLRHTHAALLIAQGEHPKLIQTRFGHSSIRVTFDTYGHLFEGLDEAAADRLDSTLLKSIAG